jgi:Protein of unknown function DUF262/Protein of unknown function (DUF1524)
MSKTGPMSVAHTGLGQILKDYKLQVPKNQREYSWTDKEVTTLFQDWSAAIDNAEEEYFLGTIVAVAIGSGLLEIVDGQQRLATTSIFMAAARDYLRKSEPVMAQSIDSDFLTASTRSRRDTEPKLQLNVRDNEFFRSMIAGKKPIPKGGSHEKIAEASELAQDHIKKVVAPFDEKQHGDKINTWIEFIQHKAQVILLTIPSAANAYRMFETLNDRGLKTTQADLVKNYLFGRSGDRIAEAQEKWASMRGVLDSLDEDEVPTVTYLRHALMLRRGYFREGDLYDEVQKAAKSEPQVIELLDTLESLASDYVATFNPESEIWNGYPDAIRDAIRPLNLMNIKPLRPLMLAVASRFSKKEASIAFGKFISWDVRFLIAGATLSGGSIEVPLAAAAKKVYEKEIDTEKKLTETLSSVVPNDEQFKQAFANTTVSKAALARYYLRSVEMVSKEEPNPWFIPNSDRETINLEHVLPQKPGDNWPQFDPQMAKADYKRLGNMVLLQAKQNSVIKSARFEDKKPLYAAAPYLITNQVGASPVWNHHTIVERQSLLADAALKAWPL